MPHMTHRNHSEQPTSSHTGTVRGSARRARALLLAGLLAGLALGACTTTASDPTVTPAASAAASPTAGGVPQASPSAVDPSAQPSSGRSTALVTIRRSGGIAGLDDRIDLDAQGNWTHTAKGAQPRTGTLTAAQLDRLRTLAADPRLIQEAARPSAPAGCADGFNYQVIVKGVQVGYTDCGGAGLPVAATALFTFIAQAVGV
jgi:hypothetical protein